MTCIALVCGRSCSEADFRWRSRRHLVKIVCFKSRHRVSSCASLPVLSAGAPCIFIFGQDRLGCRFPPGSNEERLTVAVSHQIRCLGWGNSIKDGGEDAEEILFPDLLLRDCGRFIAFCAVLGDTFQPVFILCTSDFDFLILQGWALQILGKEADGEDEVSA